MIHWTILVCNDFKILQLTESFLVSNCNVREKSAVAFSLGGDNLKRYFDQK